MLMERDPRVKARVHRRLRWQLWFFFTTFVAMAALVGVQIVRHGVNPLWAVAGFASGVLIGLVVTRIRVLRWNRDERVVVASIDALGVLIMVVYGVFLLLRGRIVGEWVSRADAAGVVILAMTAGTMFGRIHFTLRGVRRVLVERKIRRPEGS